MFSSGGKVGLCSSPVVAPLLHKWHHHHATLLPRIVGTNAQKNTELRFNNGNGSPGLCNTWLGKHWWEWKAGTPEPNPRHNFPPTNNVCSYNTQWGRECLSCHQPPGLAINVSSPNPQGWGITTTPLHATTSPSHCACLSVNLVVLFLFRLN